MFPGKHFISFGVWLAKDDPLDVRYKDEKSFIVPSKMVFPEVEFQTGERYFARCV